MSSLIGVTPGFTITSSAGAVGSGARSVAFANSGNAAAILLGQSLPAGVSLTWEAPARATLGEFPYDATGTTLIITTVR